MKQVTMFKAVVRNLGPHAMTRRLCEAMTAAHIPVVMSDDGLDLKVSRGVVRTQMTDKEIIYRWFDAAEPVPPKVIEETMEGFAVKPE